MRSQSSGKDACKILSSPVSWAALSRRSAGISREDGTMFGLDNSQTGCYRFFPVRDDFIRFRVKLANTLAVVFCFLLRFIPIGFILVYISGSIWIFNIYI